MLSTVVNHKSLLGECPVWDERHNRILWVDILSREIHSYELPNQQHNTIPVGNLIGSIAIESSDNLIAAVANKISRINIETGNSDTIAELGFDFPECRFNDGKCDAAGRFWIGSMSTIGKKDAGNLYTLNGSKADIKLSGIGCSNGMAWNSDNSLFYYIDSSARSVRVFDFNLETGNISYGRVLIKFSEQDGIPDGMTIDSAGMLWIAFWDGWRVGCYDSQSGMLMQNIMLPVARPTSCVFGGSELNHLFITTARSGLTETDLAKQPMAGSLFMYGPMKQKGYAPNSFKI